MPKPRLSPLSFALIGALGLLLVAEVGLRVLTSADSKWNVRLGASKQHDPIAIFRNKPFYDYGQGLVANEYGYLAPHDLDEAPPPDALRILYLGDSNTVTPRYTHYPVAVERIVEGELGVDVQTVNTAVPGYSSLNARLLFEGEVVRFDADHFVVYLGWNDLGQYGPEGLPYKRVAQGYEVSPIQRVLSNVYTIRFVYAVQRYRQRSTPARYGELTAEERALYAAYEPDHFVENMRAILARAKERYPNVYVGSIATITNEDPTASELATAHFPVGMGKNMKKLHLLVMKYDAAVRAVAAETGVEVLDFHARFDDREARKSFTDSCHMNADGAEMLGEVVAEAILRRERRDPTLPRDPTGAAAAAVQRAPSPPGSG
jgi:lysophospholipase L1-like esterase